uniref:Putative RNase H family protein n=1 Tax=Malus domestica TaxID=3750 RepID=E4Z8P3_MALDO|nr:putative RNase H family protein [Malus domestica]
MPKRTTLKRRRQRRQNPRGRHHCCTTTTRGWGQVVVNDLKELNLGTNEEPKPMFFSNRLMDELCKKYKFKQHKSFMCHAPANGLVEAFNKTLCNLLKKVFKAILPLNQTQCSSFARTYTAHGNNAPRLHEPKLHTAQCSSLA